MLKQGPLKAWFKDWNFSNKYDFYLKCLVFLDLIWFSFHKVHAGLSEEEKIKMCRALNYRKLSAEACKHLSENSKFPSKIITQALNSQEFKLKSLIRVSSNTSAFTSSPCSFSGNVKKEEAGKQIVLYAGDLDLSTDNVRLRVQLHGMQSRVTELEKLCRKMQTQMAKVLRSRVSSSHKSRSLPRLCSW